MKNLRSESDKEKAQELFKIIEQRKRLEKAESELKEYFKAICDGESALKAGDVLIIFTECERAMLDRKLLEAELGMDRVKEFEKVTTYIKTEVKSA